VDGFKIQGEWDANKDQANLVKHGVSFTTALKALSDPLAVTRFDADHGESENDGLRSAAHRSVSALLSSTPGATWPPAPRQFG
jgi:uncharacterized DUF497 family protein